MFIILSLISQSEPMTLDIAKIKFAKAIATVQRLELIGEKSVPRAGKDIKIAEVFSERKRLEFSVREASNRSSYSVSAGPNSPGFWVHPDGSLKLYDNIYRLPARPIAPLSAGILEEHAKKALACLNAFSPTTWDLTAWQSMYSTPEEKSKHPYVSYSIVRRSNGVPWGPGDWGKLSLVDFTGEVCSIVLNREFSAIELFDDALSVQEGEAYAARAVLALDNCDQVSLVKSGTKMVTGNAMLGGTYRTATPRVRMIASKSIGVLAYEYIFGNDDYSLNGKYAILHEVIIDAKSGDALRIQTPMPLGGSAPGKTPPRALPTSKVKALIRYGSKKQSLGYVTLRESAKPTGAKFTPAVLQLGQRYVEVATNGTAGVLVGQKYYKITRVK